MELPRALEVLATEAAALPAPQVARMHRVLADAQKDVAAELADWLDAHPEDGASRFTAAKLKQALVQLQEAQRILKARVGGALGKALQDGNARAGSLAHDHLKREVQALSKAFTGVVRPVKIAQAAALADANSLLIPRHRNSANRYGTQITEDFRHQLAIGVAKGESFEELTNRLVRHGGPRGFVSLRGTLGEPGAIGEQIAEGLFVRYRHWAERVVRTEVMDAYNTHHAVALADLERRDPGYSKRWDAFFDRRTCPVCKAFDGVVLAVDAEFAPGVPRPPAHPNDRCRLTAWRKEWAEAATVAGGPATAVNRSATAGSATAPKPARKPQRLATATREEITERTSVPPAGPVTRSELRDDVMPDLLDGKVTSRLKQLHGGTSGTYRVTLKGSSGRRLHAVWKPSSEEAALRAYIAPGTAYKREAAAFAVAADLGVADLVPPTVARELKPGVGPGAMQVFVQGAKANGYATLDRGAAERMRVFDFVIGNTDRHDENYLIAAGNPDGKPILIDHGFAFSNGRTERFIQPWRAIKLHRGPLRDETLAIIDRIDVEGIATKLHAAGLEKDAVRRTVRRAAVLKRRPALLEVGGPPEPLKKELYWNDALVDAEVTPSPYDAFVEKLYK